MHQLFPGDYDLANEIIQVFKNGVRADCQFGFNFYEFFNSKKQIQEWNQHHKRNQEKTTTSKLKTIFNTA
ncbi:MAG: hypothetical protein R2764_19735 [Bacteroidales bacterium]